MDQDVTPKSTGLENELRNMILSNVTISGGHPNHATDHKHSRQVRGRARGRGRGGFNPSAHDQGRLWDQGPQNSTAPPQRGTNMYASHSHQGRPFGHGARGSYHQQSTLNGSAPPGMQPPSLSQHSRYGGPPSAHGLPNAPSPPYARSRAPYSYQPRNNQRGENPMKQIEHLDLLAAQEVPKVEMSLAELEEKEAFRQRLEHLFQKTFEAGSSDIATISLVGFGSLASGFGIPGSDMDLAVVPKWKDLSKANEVGVEQSTARLLERAVLDNKMGGRLLTRTRVPILKICESPTEVLYNALLEERNKWEELPEEEKYPATLPPEPSPHPKPSTEIDALKPIESTKPGDNPNSNKDFPELGTEASTGVSAKGDLNVDPNEQSVTGSEITHNTSHKEQPGRPEKLWTREKINGPLDFPKTGIGIQCDVNFGNPLGIHNTHMLRCYSLADPRVRPIVLFVKSWAKTRKINSSYSGTLSSYGWVLMVLHYLVNIADPPVLPNLQHSVPQPTDLSSLETFCKANTVSGYDVRYWKDEQEIVKASQSGRLSRNRESVGALLRGFFQYFASLSPGSNRWPLPSQFYWTTEVLSLRTMGGITTKNKKGWVAAKTTVTAEKKVTNRYLFAIEDPFEIDHNVARTVTHRGIVAIRDEFRRAWRILRAIGQGQEPEGGFFDEIVECVASPLPHPEAQDESRKLATEEGAGGQIKDSHATQTQPGVMS